MTASSTPPERVPTLTEVVHWPETPAASPPRVAPAAVPVAESTSVAPSAASLLVAPAAGASSPPPAAVISPALRAAPTGSSSAASPIHVAPQTGPRAVMPAAPAQTTPTAGAEVIAFVGAATQSAQEQLTQQIFADLQRQVELMLEYRLRETLAPLLARAADSIVRDARTELASTLRDVVARAVAQELARHRNR